MRQSVNHNNVMRDVYDGEKYLHMKQKGWFKTAGDVAMILSTDGGSMFKSSGVEAWPVWGVLTNLEPAIRLV